MTITIQSEGRRHYLIGDTYSIRNQLRAAGAHWDGDRKAWWTSKRDVAESFASAGASSDIAPGSHPDGDRLTQDSRIAGKARYQDREYILVWEGETRRGRACKLAYRDGSKVFWADAAQVQVTKRYEAREERGQMQHMTFGRLERMRTEYTVQRNSERQLGAKDGFVGERSAIHSRFEGSRDNRKPSRNVGDVCWLKHGGQRIAFVVVGYELASYLRGEDAEDMGHFDIKNGWYGTLFYRRATLAEAQELQSREPREDAVMPAASAASSASE